MQALLKLARISEPQLSPDGKTVAFTVQTVDLEQNTKPKQIYVVPTDGGTPHQITTQGTDNERPQWSPDSKHIAFISNRSGSAQVWIMNADGSDARQVTNISTEAGGVLVFTERQEAAVHQRRLSRLPGRRLQQDPPGCGEVEQGEGAQLHDAALPSLDRVAIQAALASDGGGCLTAAR